MSEELNTSAQAEDASSTINTPPHPDRAWHLAAARDLTTAYLDYTPEVDGEIPIAREILEYAIALGIPEDLLFSEETLTRAIQNTQYSGIPLKSYAISNDCDSSYEIVVSEDKLQGMLSVSKALGRGTPLNLKKLGEDIRDSGFSGMNIAKIKQDILAFYHGTIVRLENYVLASGSAPVAGKPREITWDIEFLDESEVDSLKQKNREAPKPPKQEIPTLADMAVVDVPEMAFVQAETIIISLTPKDPGRLGVDVFGVPLPPTDDMAIQLETHENVRFDNNAVVSEQDGILDRWPVGEGGYAIRVRPYRDAVITVNISDDAMLASVKLIDGIGSGKFLSTESVRQALIGAGVIKGIDIEAIDAAIFRASTLGDASEIVVARGRPSVEPGESRIKFHVPLASGKGVTLRDDGTADFRNQDRITSVNPEQLIAEIVTEQVEIADGWDVRSKIIKGDENQQLPVVIGEGIRQESAGNGLSKLYAIKAGELVYDGTAIAVADIHTIQGDVGPTSGNVKFGGSVNITGSVLGSFFVMSKGTIKVADGVGASLLSADESIHVVNGVKGGNKAVIRARREISVGFMELATVMAVGDVTIEKTCLNSTIKCNGMLSLASDKGRLVGGHIRARSGVSAQQIGSKSGAATHISFGQDYLIGDKIELEEREIAKLQNELVRLERLIHTAEHDKAIADVKKGRTRKLHVLKLLEKRTERLFWLRERFEQHFPSKVTVPGIIYPGVSLESHGRTLKIDAEKRNVELYFDPESGHIVERVLEKAGKKTRAVASSSTR